VSDEKGLSPERIADEAVAVMGPFLPTQLV
jgi:hypothetical protein